MTQRLFEGQKVEIKEEKPYIAIPVEMEILDRGEIAALVEEVYSWLKRRKIEPAGQPFCRYWVMGGVEEKFSLEVGIPVERMISGDERIVASFIPGGSYAFAVHKGTTEYLDDTSYALEKWAEDEGLELDKRYEGETEIWNGRFEFFEYQTNEGSHDQSDIVEVAFLLMRDIAA
ncbi:GyrI-like domain-containing protein [Metaplanococcus flavidus]|uniref:GyrI-like domain-containing protein n=1 Tax=Metaplanococcus flavidus TaxID=569883 RepID=A0ABW3L9S1_9BACL